MVKAINPYNKARQQEILAKAMELRRKVQDAVGFPVLVIRNNKVTYTHPIVVIFVAIFSDGLPRVYLCRRGSKGDYAGYMGCPAGYPNDAYDANTGLFTVEQDIMVGRRETEEETKVSIPLSRMEPLTPRTTVDFLYGDLVPCIQTFFMFYPTRDEIEEISPDGEEMEDDDGWYTAEEVQAMIDAAMAIKDGGESEENCLVMPESYGPALLEALDITDRRFIHQYKVPMPTIV